MPAAAGDRLPSFSEYSSSDELDRRSAVRRLLDYLGITDPENRQWPPKTVRGVLSTMAWTMGFVLPLYVVGGALANAAGGDASQVGGSITAIAGMIVGFLLGTARARDAAARTRPRD